MDDNSLEELQDLVIRIEASIQERNKLKDEFDNLSNSNSSSVSIDEQLKRKKRISDLKEIIEYYEESFPKNIKRAYKQLNQLKDSFLENYDESLELANYNKSIEEKEKEIASIRIRRSGLEKRMAELQFDSKGRTEEEIRHLLDLGENTSKQLKEKLQSLYTEVEYMKNNKNNINSVIFPKEILDLEESLEKYCLLLDIDKDSMIELSVQGNDDPDVGGHGKDVPSDDDKGKDVPSDDDKGKNDTYDTLKKHVEEATKKLSDAKEEFNEEFTLSSLNTQDLTNFENKHFEDIDKFIALCNNLLSNIDNPEIAKKNSGYNKFIADYNELKSEVTNAKQVALNREQAGKTPRMPKEEDDPNPDNYKDTSEYSSLMKGIETLKENINNAKEYVSDYFKDLNDVSESVLTTFEYLYLKQIKHNISTCENILKTINNPELYKESGFNELKKESNELNEMFEDVKKSVQAKEQAGHSFEEKLEQYGNLVISVDKQVQAFMLKYYFTYQDALYDHELRDMTFKAYQIDIPNGQQGILEDLYYWFPNIDSDRLTPENIDDYISDCNTILETLKKVDKRLDDRLNSIKSKLDEANRFYDENFKDLDKVSNNNLNEFVELLDGIMYEINTYESMIGNDNPEADETSELNALKKESNKLKEKFEKVIASVQEREQAGQTPPPEEENNDKDFESKLNTYESYLNQIKQKVSSICSTYNFDVNDRFEDLNILDLNISGLNTTIFEPLMKLSFKEYGKEAFIYGQPIDCLQDLYSDFPDPNEVISSYSLSPDNIDNYIDDCKLIIDALDRVEQDLKPLEEAGKGGKDDDDSKAGSGKDIYNNLLAELSALEALISNTENNIDYYDSTPNNSKTLLDLQTKYNNIDQKIRENKTIMPEYLHTQLTSRLNKCKERIDTIDYNIFNPPPKPVEPKTHIEFKEKYVVGDQEFDRRIRST